MFPSTTSALWSRRRKGMIKQRFLEMRIYTWLSEIWCQALNKRMQSNSAHILHNAYVSFYGKGTCLGLASVNTARSESAGPGPSCAVEPPLCHSLAATGVLMSDIMFNTGLIRAGQKPVTRLSLQPRSPANNETPPCSKFSQNVFWRS